jgi:hypothetical protein
MNMLTQLWNRRKANISVFVELLFVFILIWYMADYLFVYAYNRHIPNHRDVDHTWQVNLNAFPPGHPSYQAEEDNPQALYDNYHHILRILQNYPGVEAVSVAAASAVPGTGNYMGRAYYALSDTSRRVSAQEMAVYPATDFFRVFRHTRKEGAEPAAMSDFDWGVPQAVVVSQSVADALFPGGNVIGQQLVYDLGNTGDPMTVTGVVDDTKRFDYLRPRHAVYPAMTKKMEEWDVTMWLNKSVISIRSAASTPDALFAETFVEAMERDLQAGNFFFKSLDAYSLIADTTALHFGISTDLKVRIYLMIFFLLNILLCVLGTFWYRVNLRRSETGLRMAMGARRTDIYRLFFFEGLCLLAFAALVAMAVEFQFVYGGLIDTFGKDWGGDTDTVYLIDRPIRRFLITNGITAALLSAIILAAIAFPARRAATLPPRRSAEG